MARLAFDTLELSAGIERDAAIAFERDAQVAYGVRPAVRVRTLASAFADTALFFVWVACCVGTVFLPFVFESESRQLDEPIERFAFGLVLIIPMSIVFFLLAALVLKLLGSGKQDAFARYRLNRFAEANGMEYTSKLAVAGGEEAYDVVRLQLLASAGLREGPTRIEIGNLHFPVSDAQPAATYFGVGYVAITLPVSMPHIVLDSKRMCIALSLGATIEQDQWLSLEGDFDRYFQLYCAEGYERDALYIFTPDVMQSFIQGAATLSAEFRNDVCYLYSAQQLSTLAPERWNLVAGAINAVLPQLRSWQRWREEGKPQPAHDTGARLPNSMGEATELIREAPREPEASARSVAPGARADSMVPVEVESLLNYRADGVRTSSLKRRVPLWIRFVQFGGAAYAIALVSLLFALD